MSDKGWHLPGFCSAFLHLNAGNIAMPLNPRPNLPPYVIFFVLYEFCVALNCIYLKFYFPLLWNWYKSGSHLMQAFSSVGSILQSNLKNVVPAGLSCMISDDIFTKNCIYLTFLFPLFWNSKCFCGSLRENWKQNGSHLMKLPY